MSNQFLEEHLGEDWVDYFNVQDYEYLVVEEEYLYE